LEKGRKVSVTAYAGHRGEEQPRSFVIGDKKIDVVEVVARWIREVSGTGERARSFRVEGSDGYIYLLSYREGTGEWYLE
jgi:hypothetical protein